MALALNKILISGLNTGQAGATWQNANVTCGVGNATTGLATYIPPGIGWITVSSNVLIEVNIPTANAATNGWTTMYGNNIIGMYISDGQNLRANAISGTQTISIVTVSPGAAANVAGTFNAS